MRNVFHFRFKRDIPKKYNALTKKRTTDIHLFMILHEHNKNYLLLFCL